MKNLKKFTGVPFEKFNIHVQAGAIKSKNIYEYQGFIIYKTIFSGEGNVWVATKDKESGMYHHVHYFDKNNKWIGATETYASTLNELIEILNEGINHKSDYQNTAYVIISNEFIKDTLNEYDKEKIVA